VRGVEFYFRETAAGMRRNGTIAFGAVMTAFIALFLFGLALLIRREIGLVVEQLTGNVQLAVYVDDTAAHNPDTIAHLEKVISNIPAVDTVFYEDQQATCARARRVFAANPTIIENVPCSAYPTSFRITLNDTSQYEQIPAALACETDATGKMACSEPGVMNVVDYHDVLDRLSAITAFLSIGLFALSLIMLVSAVVLVASTLRMGMFARRKEISIMRLVGATNWRIRVPFLIEGSVEALVGAGLAIAFLFLFKVLLVDQFLAGTLVWLPLIRNNDVLVIVPWILMAAVFVSVVAGTIGMRRFLDV
jgi:cell division transport system permease protein